MTLSVTSSGPMNASKIETLLRSAIFIPYTNVRNLNIPAALQFITLFAPRCQHHRPSSVSTVRITDYLVGSDDASISNIVLSNGTDVDRR